MKIRLGRTAIAVTMPTSGDKAERSATSSLAVALAQKFKMTLVGLFRGESCPTYAETERIDS